MHVTTILDSLPKPKNEKYTIIGFKRPSPLIKEINTKTILWVVNLITPTYKTNIQDIKRLGFNIDRFA